MQLLIVMLLSSMLSQTITWTTKASLPQRLAGSGCAIINDTIYVIGGRDSYSNQYKTNYVYDPVTNSWSTKAEMPTARAHIACAVINGKIYAIGGWMSSGASDAVEEYDPLNDVWTPKARMPTARYAYGMAVVSDKIYVIGGFNNIAGQIYATVEEYDPSADTAGGTPWLTKTSMPTARMGPGCTVINDTIYVFGGCTAIGAQVTSVNQCYDPITDVWTTKASMLSAKYCMGAFSYDSKAYSVGGFDFSFYFNSVEVYVPLSNSWSYETPMNYERQSIAVGLVGNKVYVIGGWNNGALDYNEEGMLPVGVEEQQAVQKMEIEIGPNPFSTTTHITLSLPSTGQSAESIELNIYDVTGRLVKTFSLTTDHSALTTAFSWDGKSNNGTPLPSGTYFLVVNSQGISERRVLNLIR